MPGQYFFNPPQPTGAASTGSITGVPYIVGPLDGSPANAQGGYIGSSTFFQQSATATFPGLVSSAAQTFAGVKTFNSAPNLPSLSVSAPVKTDGSKNLASGSISLTADVTGNLPLSQTQGSLSLTTQVVGILPIANGGSTGSNSGDLSLAAVGSSPNANAASIGVGQVLTLQPADPTNSGVMTALSQSFSGTKTFTFVGLNDASADAAMHVTSSGNAGVTFVAKGNIGQTADIFRILDSGGNPKVVYDTNAPSFKLYHNAASPEAPIDFRPAITLATMSSGSSARYGMFIGNTSSTAAGIGAGLTLGGSGTNSSAQTEYAIIWVTKNNNVAGDVDSTLHFAPRNNSLNKFVRSLDIDQSGNCIFSGNLKICGSASGAVTVQSPATVATPYTVTLPGLQGSSSASYLTNDGQGSLAWSTTKVTIQTFTTIGSNSYFTPPTAKAILVRGVGGGGGSGGAATGAATSSAGGGGGGGGYFEKLITGSALSNVYGFVIGAGGVAASSGNNPGTTGSATTFGSSFLTGNGGGPGQGGGAVTLSLGGQGGSGGTASGGDLNVSGGNGGYGDSASAGSAVSGTGGGSHLSGGAAAVYNGNQAGNAGTNYGGGGSGGMQINGGGNQAGAAGAQGAIFVYEYY